MHTRVIIRLYSCTQNISSVSYVDIGVSYLNEYRQEQVSIMASAEIEPIADRKAVRITDKQTE